MSVVIRPADIQWQLRQKRARETDIQIWCSERIDAIAAFSSESVLKGEAWDAARQHLQEYTSFFACMRYGASIIDSVDAQVMATASSLFGDVAEVAEDHWRSQKTQAERHVRECTRRINMAKTLPSPISSWMVSSISRQRSSWKQCSLAATRMLERIAEYQSRTNNSYTGLTDGIEKSLVHGTKAIKACTYGSAGWSRCDMTWLAEMKSACDTGVTNSDDLFLKNGALDESKTGRILTKPTELWTEGEYVAIACTYERVSKEATGDYGIVCKTDNLNAFLNCGYIPVSAHETQVNDGLDGLPEEYTVEVTYQMSPSMAAFLTLVQSASDKKAYDNLGNLDDWEYIMAGTATALLNGATRFTVTSHHTAVPSLDPLKSETQSNHFDKAKDLRSSQEVSTGIARSEGIGSARPNIKVSLNKQATLDGDTILKYDDISYGESNNGFDLKALIKGKEPDGNKHIYVFRDNGNVDGNIDGVNILEAHRDYQEAVEAYNDYGADAFLDDSIHALTGLAKTAVKAEFPTAFAAYEEVKRIHEFVDGADKAYDATIDARNEVDKQIDLSQKHQYINRANADNGIVIYSPDEHTASLNCVGYDSKSDGNARRSNYEQAIADYNSYKSGTGGNSMSFTEWYDARQ